MDEAIFVLNSDGTVTLRRSGRKRLMLEAVLGGIPAPQMKRSISIGR